MTRFAFLAERIDVRGKGIVLPLLSVSQTLGVIRRSEISDKPPRADSLDIYKVAKKGDIVFNKMSIRSGAMGVAMEDGLVTYHYEVLRPREIADARFIVYLMKSSWFTAEMVKRERGIGAGGAQGVRTTEVPFSVLGAIPTYVPPLPAQRAIADYLDRETAEIDAMAAELAGLEAQLLSRRDAAWESLYSKMDGDEVSVQYLIESIADGPFGSALTSSHYSDSGCRVIRLGNIGIDEFRDTDHAYIPDSYGRELSRHSVAPGDIVMAGLGDDKMPLGRACVVPYSALPAIVKADCYRLRPQEEVVTSDFLAWALSSPPLRRAASLQSRGSTRARLNTEIAKSLRVKVPDLASQTRIVSEWTISASTIDSMIADAQELKALLAELRSALITEVVTGRKEVPVS